MIRNINGIRFVLAFLVVICHVINYAPIGDIAVTYFFMISGFFIGLKYRCGTKPYTLFNVKKTLIKLYPVYIGSVLMFFCFQTILLKKPIIEMSESLFAHIFLIQNWLPYKYVEPLNSPSWYLSSYFFLLLSLCLLSKIRNKLLSTSILLTAIFFIFIYGLTQDIFYQEYYFYFFGPIHIIEFLSAWELGKVTNRKSLKKTNTFYRNLIQIITILFVVFSFYIRTLNIIPISLSRSIVYIPSGLLFIIVFYLTDKDNAILNKILKSNILQYLGNLSMGIFLYHYIYVRIFSHLYPDFNYIATFCIVMCCAIMTSLLSRKYIETPIINYFAK